MIAYQEWERLKKGEGLKKSLKMAAVLQGELIELSAKLPLTNVVTQLHSLSVKTN